MSSVVLGQICWVPVWTLILKAVVLDVGETHPEALKGLRIFFFYLRLTRQNFDYQSFYQ